MVRDGGRASACLAGATRKPVHFARLDSLAVLVVLVVVEAVVVVGGALPPLPPSPQRAVALGESLGAPVSRPLPCWLVV